MNEIKKYIEFFFQTERIHPFHMFAVFCFVITLVTLPFEIFVAIMRNNIVDLILKSVILICLSMVFIGVRKAYLERQKTDL